MSIQFRPAVCVICAITFSRKTNTTGKYCSRRCAWLARGGPEFNARIARATSGKRADAMRDKGACVNTYRKRDGRHEHRQVAEKKIGRPLLRSEVVHHIDHNKRNNDPSNLVVLSRAEHMREHGIGIPGAPLPWKPWEYKKRKDAR